MKIKESEINRLAKHIGKSGKHTLILGEAGVGKSMIAVRAQKYLPPLTEGQDELFDIYYAARMIDQFYSQGIRRPMRAPHHTISIAGLIGSKPNKTTLVPRFGELSLAHRGLLVLDEIPEFNRKCLEHVAYAMKHKNIIHGMGNIGWPNWPYPTDFQLVATANECPCGWLRSSNTPCVCTTPQVLSYRKRFEMIKFEEVIEFIDGIGKIRPMDGEIQTWHPRKEEERARS
jgi:magnesium chelatase family protein